MAYFDVTSAQTGIGGPTGDALRAQANAIAAVDPMTATVLRNQAAQFDAQDAQNAAGPSVSSSLMTSTFSAANDWANVIRQWEAGVTNSITYDQAVALRQQAADGIAKGGTVTPAAQANLDRWDAYVAKLNVVSKMTPAQYAQYRANGSSGSGGGGLLSLFQGQDPAKSASGSFSSPTGSGSSYMQTTTTPVGGSSTATIVLFAGLGIGALYLLGGRR